MSTEDKNPNDTVEIHEGDILFDCPFCGKNMAIEAGGAGLMVPCASCGKSVQVPIPDTETPESPVASPAAVSRADPDGEEDPRETIRQLDAALGMANQQLDRLMAEKEELQERRAFLEQTRSANVTRLEQIATELSAVQDMLDRALGLLAEARSEKPV